MNRIKNTLRLLLDPFSIFVGVALANFIVIWIGSLNCSIGLCFLCPWYCPWTFTNPPTLLLLAACALRFRRWWSCLIAVLLSLFVLTPAVPMAVYLTANGELFREMREYTFRFLFTLEGQWLLALAIFLLGIVLVVRAGISRRFTSRGGIQHALGADSP